MAESREIDVPAAQYVGLQIQQVSGLALFDFLTAAGDRLRVTIPAGDLPRLRDEIDRKLMQGVL